MLSPWSLLLCLFYLGGGGEFAIYCFHRFLGVFLSMSSVHLSRFGFCRERGVRTRRWWEVREWGKKCVQWEVCGIQLIDQSDRTLCPGTLSNSSKDNCSQDVCLWACVSLYLCEDILHILLWLKSNFGLLFHCAERVRGSFKTERRKEERFSCSGVSNICSAQRMDCRLAPKSSTYEGCVFKKNTVKL